MEIAENRSEQQEGFEGAVERGITVALSSIAERYENHQNPRENRPFHNVEHTEGVIRRTTLILETIQKVDPSLVSDRDIELGRIASAFHDTVQDWEENKVPDGEFTKIIRKRHTGANETNSANEAQVFMTSANQTEKIFSDVSADGSDDFSLVRNAIETTAPGWDQKNKTMMQPKLEKSTSLISVALALSDLGVGGMEGGEQSAQEAKKLFREENLDILDAMHGKDPSQIPEDKKKYFRQRMVNWMRAEPAIVVGRKDRLEQEMQAIPAPARKAVTKLFSSFDESIAARERAAEAAQKMDFDTLVKDMGY